MLINWDILLQLETIYIRCIWSTYNRKFLDFYPKINLLNYETKHGLPT